MNKKNILIAIIIILFFSVSYGIYNFQQNKKILTETTPLLNSTSSNKKIPTLPSTTPIPNPTTKIELVLEKIPDEVSSLEVDKIASFLPIRINDFSTSLGIKTTINIYQSQYDPSSTVRFEIYNLNYNERYLQGRNAIAFKESFLEAKKQLASQKVNLKNLQILYGNRQYIQDTATYWVKAFKLLD